MLTLLCKTSDLHILYGKRLILISDVCFLKAYLHQVLLYEFPTEDFLNEVEGLIKYNCNALPCSDRPFVI